MVDLLPFTNIYKVMQVILKHFDRNKQKEQVFVGEGGTLENCDAVP